MRGEGEYALWFQKNCDNHNIPDYNAIISRDYEAWFARHAEKRCACSQNNSNSYEAWFERNCDNHNIPDYNAIISSTYDAWFERHSEKRKVCDVKVNESYEDWFFRHCYAAPVVQNTPCRCCCKKYRSYENWFLRHKVPSLSYGDCAPKPDYLSWFKKHSS